MIESNTMDVLPPPGEAEAASDDEPGPSPAGVVVLHDAWRDLQDSVLTVHEAVNAAIRFVPMLADGEIAIALSSDADVQALNGRFRGKDTPTNVLSFPGASGPHGSGDAPSGDIVIAFETVAREAADEDKPVLHHLAHLTVHGLLHLAGHDHDADGDAEIMEALERRILESLNIPDPYRSNLGEDRPALAETRL
jgi:probable rRNA maturation factor